MKSLLLAAASAGAFFCTNVAMAQTYFGANYVMASYKETGFPTFKPTVLALRIGNQVNRNFAYEGRAGFGIGDDSKTVLGVPVSVDIDHFFGIYGRGILPVSDMFSVYALLGFTSGKATFSVPGLSISDSDSDISFGVGADWMVSKDASLNVEWAQLFEGTDYKVQSLAIGVTLKF